MDFTFPTAYPPKLQEEEKSRPPTSTALFQRVLGEVDFLLTGQLLPVLTFVFLVSLCALALKSIGCRIPGFGVSANRVKVPKGVGSARPHVEPKL